MQFDPPLIAATLKRRYNRFLADVVFDDGSEATAHCPNPGRMTGVAPPGARVWLTPVDDPKRKLKFTWRLVEVDGGLVGIDTNTPNRLTAEALRAERIDALAGYSTIRAEVKYGEEKSRADFMLEDPAKGACVVEVKNVHLMREAGLAEFPDSITARGAKHLREMAKVVQAGGRAVMVYVVQRMDCTRLRFARDVDPAYGAAFDAARAAGVEAIAHRCDISERAITLTAPITIDED